jgi:hypothetical protein
MERDRLSVWITPVRARAHFHFKLKTTAALRSQSARRLAQQTRKLREIFPRAELRFPASGV